MNSKLTPRHSDFRRVADIKLACGRHRNLQAAVVRAGAEARQGSFNVLTARAPTPAVVLGQVLADDLMHLG